MADKGLDLDCNGIWVAYPVALHGAAQRQVAPRLRLPSEQRRFRIHRQNGRLGSDGFPRRLNGETGLCPVA
jgi:hypothetical protein